MAESIYSECGQPLIEHRFIKHFVSTCNNLGRCSLYAARQGIRDIAPLIDQIEEGEIKKEG